MAVEKARHEQASRYAAMGVAIGAGVGATIGVLRGGWPIAVGVSVGAGDGVAIGAAIDAQQRHPTEMFELIEPIGVIRASSVAH